MHITNYNITKELLKAGLLDIEKTLDEEAI